MVAVRVSKASQLPFVDRMLRDLLSSPCSEALGCSVQVVNDESQKTETLAWCACEGREQQVLETGGRNVAYEWLVWTARLYSNAEPRKWRSFNARVSFDDRIKTMTFTTTAY